jgi:hypothetical protein
LLEEGEGDDSYVYIQNMNLLAAHNAFLTEGFNTDYFNPAN